MHGPCPLGSCGRAGDEEQALFKQQRHLLTNQAMSEHYRLCALQGLYMGKGVVTERWALGILLREYPQPHWELEGFTLLL